MKQLNNSIAKYLNRLLLLMTLSLTVLIAYAEPPLDIATKPLANSGPKKIKPNMLYVLDDSGSMDRDFMPDWASDSSGSHPGLTYHIDASYNSVAYNPAVRYDPPVYYTSTGQRETTTYPSQDGTSTTRGNDGTSTRNWRAVKSDAYNPSTYKRNLETIGGANFNGTNLPNPQYAVSIANEYCTRSDLRVCVKSDIPTATHPYPARIRWCNDATVAGDIALPADNACQSVRLGAFTHMRIPLGAASPSLPSQATFSVDRARWTPRVDQITVNGQRIMSWSTSTSNNTSRLAQETADRINQCTNTAIWNCTVSGYSASVSGSVVTIYAPTNTTSTPSISYSSGTINYTRTAFAQPAVAALREIVDIVPSNNSYVYPGTTAKHSARTDCAGTTCTYVEEMTNYANWFAYYHRRMQMMKTATSIAFEDIGEDFRMGLMTINSHAALDFKDFSGSDKATWYRTLFGINANGGTPLPRALSNAGRVYANKYTQGGIFSDPIEYACQANYTLLTTDGVYNGDNSFRAGYELDGSTYIGDEDSGSTVSRPKRDALGQAGTLADVAKYYRDTDLRTTSLNNCTGANGNGVCETSGTLDKIQSMVTFTLGLGVDGGLAYSTTYLDDAAGDFADLKSGVKNWPDAQLWNTNWNFTDDIAAARTDDVWHAAVNGDGRYFSAKDTNSLINQLRQAVSLIKVKTGAGAAAATSTLNPVAGDNFAYLASYTTGFWQGNLEKRAVDPKSGEIKKAALACVEDVIPQDNCASPSTVQPDGSGGYVCVTTGVTDQALCTQTLVGSECREPITPTCDGELKQQLLASPRTVYFNQAGTLAPFTYANLNATQSANLTAGFLQSNLTQAATFTTNQINNLTGDKLVDYLKGDQTYEMNSPLLDNQLFRTRSALLGDLIHSKPVHVRSSPFSYGDAGYQGFKTSSLSRSSTVYVGSNDGMLHAFDADTLQERWAFVPSMVMPNLWKLANSDYANNHQYYVNGDVTVADICMASDCSSATASDWKTILVAGLDAGGRGYYALDITNPSSPKLLWEIDPSVSGFENLGYTYSQPYVTKRSGDDKWVVVFASGYNNIPDNDTFYSSAASTDFKPNLTPQYTTGDGKGYLYVVEAATGNLLATIATGAGSVSSPSGLAKINTYVNNLLVNNVTTYVYGGDLDGNVWRFNIERGQNTVLHFAALKDAAGVAQPIMTTPRLAEIDKNRFVTIGTGKYLEVTDLDPSGFTVQSLYTLKDTANDTDPEPVYNNPRITAGIVQQTIVPSSDPTKSDERISGTNNAVDLTAGLGWYLDFPDSGERQNVDSQLVLGTLLVPTTVPTASACQPAGYGWFNFFNYKTGASVLPPGGAVSQRTTSPLVGFNVFINESGDPVVSGNQADGENNVMDKTLFDIQTGGFNRRRSIWREIVE